MPPTNDTPPSLAADDDAARDSDGATSDGIAHQTVVRATEPPETPEPAPENEDDLLAALSEIETLANEDLAETPDLRDDAPDDTPVGLTDLPAADVEPAESTMTDSDAESEAAAQHTATSDPVVEPSDGLIDEIDVSEAPADTESTEEPASVVADSATTELELDAEPFDGDSLIPDDDLVAAFAEVEHLEVAIEEEPAAEPEESPELDTTEEPADPGRALRFQIGKKPEVAADSQAATPDASNGDAIVAVPVVSLGKRLYRATDAVFELANRPFGFVGEGSRVLVGQIAIATIAISALSAIAIPLIRSDQNAVAFVREHRAAMEAENPPRPKLATPATDPAPDPAESDE